VLAEYVGDRGRRMAVPEAAVCGETFLGGPLVAASAARAAKRPATRRAGGTRAHRRVSGPARPARTPRASIALPIPRRLQAAAPALGPVAVRALHGARTLRDSNAVDRL